MGTCLARRPGAVGQQIDAVAEASSTCRRSACKLQRHALLVSMTGSGTVIATARSDVISRSAKSSTCYRILSPTLRQHSGTEIVSRDRGGIYAEAMRKAIPRAVQVADRRHLLRNLSEALRNALARTIARSGRQQQPVVFRCGSQPPKKRAGADHPGLRTFLDRWSAATRRTVTCSLPGPLFCRHVGTW